MVKIGKLMVKEDKSLTKFLADAVGAYVNEHLPSEAKQSREDNQQQQQTTPSKTETKPSSASTPSMRTKTATNHG